MPVGIVKTDDTLPPTVLLDGVNVLDPMLSEFFYERIKIICLEIQFKLISAERNAVGFDKIPIRVERLQCQAAGQRFVRPEIG